MQNFDNVEDLVSYMFENVDNETNRISLIVNRDIAVDTLKELLNYENIVLSICDIHSETDYDREYIVYLFDDVDSDEWYVSVEKAYLDEKDTYLSIDGYVLFHEDVNSKAMIDMQNNEFLPLGEHDWFTIGEEDPDDEDDTEEIDDEDSDSGYSVTVKCNLDADEALSVIKDIERRMTRIDDMFREMDCFRRLFNW